MNIQSRSYSLLPRRTKSHALPITLQNISQSIPVITATLPNNEENNGLILNSQPSKEESHGTGKNKPKASCPTNLYKPSKITSARNNGKYNLFINRTSALNASNEASIDGVKIRLSNNFGLKNTLQRNNSLVNLTNLEENKPTKAKPTIPTEPGKKTSLPFQKEQPLLAENHQPSKLSPPIQRNDLLEEQNTNLKIELQDLKECLSYRNSMNDKLERTNATLTDKLRKAEEDVKYGKIVKQQYLKRIKELEALVRKIKDPVKESLKNTHRDVSESSVHESEVQMHISRDHVVAHYDYENGVREKLFRCLATTNETDEKFGGFWKQCERNKRSSLNNL